MCPGSQSIRGGLEPDRIDCWAPVPDTVHVCVRVDVYDIEERHGGDWWKWIEGKKRKKKSIKNENAQTQMKEKERRRKEMGGGEASVRRKKARSCVP